MPTRSQTVVRLPISGRPSRMGEVRIRQRGSWQRLCTSAFKVSRVGQPGSGRKSRLDRKGALGLLAMPPTTSLTTTVVSKPIGTNTVSPAAHPRSAAHHFAWRQDG